MQEQKLNDGRTIRHVTKEEKESFTKEFDELLSKHSIVFQPTISVSKAGIVPNVEIFKVTETTNEEKPDTKTEESSSSDSEKPAE